MLKNSLIIVLLIVGFFDLNPTKIMNIINHAPSLVIEEPTQELKDATSDFAKIIKDKNDKLEVAVLANEFSKRLLEDKYDKVKFQTLNDVYVEASKLFYTDTMSKKYPDFTEYMESFLTEAIGSDEDIVLTNEHRTNLKIYLSALAWNLIN